MSTDLRLKFFSAALSSAKSLRTSSEVLNGATDVKGEKFCLINTYCNICSSCKVVKAKVLLRFYFLILRQLSFAQSTFLLNLKDILEKRFGHKMFE